MRAPLPELPDDQIVSGILRREEAAFEQLMRRYNGRLFRVARAILNDDGDAEDALQDAYLDAFRHIAAFRGEAGLGTWLTRIAANHALMRLRRRKARARLVVPFREDSGEPDAGALADAEAEPADDRFARAEVRQILERRIDSLPLPFRAVFVLRDVEGMTVQETADALSIPSSTVRTRLFRARALLRTALVRDFGAAARDAFGFAGDRCDRIVAAVLARLRADLASA